MVAHSSNVAIENEIGKSSFRHIGKSDVEKDVLNLTADFQDSKSNKLKG